MWSAAVFERLRTILHEAQIDKRVQYMIEVMFAVRKDGFKVKIFFCVRRMNEVNARRARLVPGWEAIFGWVYHLGM